MGQNNHTQSITRRPLYLFLILVSIFAAIGYGVAFEMGDDNRSRGMFIVQFSPLVAAFITKLMLQRNLRGLGWGWGRPGIRPQPMDWRF